MSAPQIIRTPSGEELVVLPRDEEYEALLERANREAEDADAGRFRRQCRFDNPQWRSA